MGDHKKCTLRVKARPSGNSTVNNFFSARTRTLSPSHSVGQKFSFPSFLCAMYIIKGSVIRMQSPNLLIKLTNIRQAMSPTCQSCSNLCHRVSSSRHFPFGEQHSALHTHQLFSSNVQTTQKCRPCYTETNIKELITT